MLSIGEFAHSTMLSIKTIRYYHEIGILQPAKVDQVNGYRYYDYNSFHKVQTILVLKDLGFTLKEITKILEECQDDNDLFAFIEEKIGDVEIQLQQLHRKKDQLLKQKYTILTGQKENSGIIEFDFEISRYASKKFWGTYEQIGEVFSYLFKHYGQYVKGKPFAFYYDLGFSNEKQNLEGLVEIDADAPIEDADQTFPRTRAVKIVHKGPYGTQGSSYFQIFNYCREHKYEIKLPIIEHFVIDPGMIFPVDPQQYKTECIVLLEV